jgi:hypothetical protein
VREDFIFYVTFSTYFEGRIFLNDGKEYHFLNFVDFASAVHAYLHLLFRTHAELVAEWPYLPLRHFILRRVVHFVLIISFVTW